jgi:hypothetical protein
VNDELEKMWKEVVMAILRYYPGICLDGWQKTMKTLNPDSQCSYISVLLKVFKELNINGEKCRTGTFECSVINMTALWHQATQPPSVFDG